MRLLIMSSPCRIKLRLVDFYRTIIFSLIYRLFYWIQFLFDSVSFHEAYSSQHILWLQLGVRCCRNNAGICTEFFSFLTLQRNRPFPTSYFFLNGIYMSTSKKWLKCRNIYPNMFAASYYFFNFALYIPQFKPFSINWSN